MILKRKLLLQKSSISKFKAKDKAEKIKYKPKKKELSRYDDYIIENNVNFIYSNKWYDLVI